MSSEDTAPGAGSAMGGSASDDQAMGAFSVEGTPDVARTDNDAKSPLNSPGFQQEDQSVSSLSHSLSSPSPSGVPSPSQGPDVVDLARSIDGLAIDDVSVPDIDSSILEALKSKDRLFVLKLGEQMEALIKERHFRSKYSLNTDTTYQRLLVHRCAAYYRLIPESEPSSKMMSVVITMESKIPVRRICELVPPEEASHPAFKIMRRAEHDRKKPKSIVSHPGSVAGEDGELSDVDPSEAGSMGGRSSTSKTRKTIAERKAEYEEARTRIFMNYEEKDKKERSASASSSSLSLLSPSEASSQNGAGEGASGDVDDGASSAPTESEWSVSYTGDRMRSNDISVSGVFSYHAGSASFIGNEGSATSSGRASPSSFNYPTLTESPCGPPYGYDPNVSFPPHMSPSNGYYQHYPGYAYPPHVAGAPYPPPPHHAPTYPYYPQYSYGPPPPHAPVPTHSSSDPGSPVTQHVEGQHRYSPPTHNPYGYSWSPPHAPHHQGTPVTMSPQHTFPSEAPVMHPPPPGPPHHGQGPPPMLYGPAPYPGYMPPPGYPQYHVPYYSHPSSSPVAYPHPQHPFAVDSPGMNGHNQDQHSSSGGSSPTFSRSNSVVSGSNSMNYAPQPQQQRAAWSHGPGAGSNGVLWGHNSNNSGNGGEKMGPRMSMGVRKTSGASSASGSSGYRTPGEEGSSTTSSSASSASSRRTFMTTPPKHPLPPRPDWATGLRPQPTLHAGRNRHHDGNGSSRNSPSRTSSQLPSVSPNHQQQQNPQNQRAQSQPAPPPVLQPNDFPPLSSSKSNPLDGGGANISNKKPAVGGSVWTNAGGTPRTILQAKRLDGGNTSLPSNGSYGNALFNHHGQSPRLDDDERGFERPPPKGGVELFNPNGGPAVAKRQGSVGNGSQEKSVGDKQKQRLDSVSPPVSGYGQSETPPPGSVAARLAAELAKDRAEKAKSGSPRPDQPSA